MESASGNVVQAPIQQRAGPNDKPVDEKHLLEKPFDQWWSLGAQPMGMVYHFHQNKKSEYPDHIEGLGLKPHLNP